MTESPILPLIPIPRLFLSGILVARCEAGNTFFKTPITRDMFYDS